MGTLIRQYASSMTLRNIKSPFNSNSCFVRSPPATAQLSHCHTPLQERLLLHVAKPVEPVAKPVKPKQDTNAVSINKPIWPFISKEANPRSLIVVYRRDGDAAGMRTLANAKDLTDYLEQQFQSVFLADRDILLGDPTMSKTLNAISHSQVCLFLLCPDSLKHDSTSYYIDYAMRLLKPIVLLACGVTESEIRATFPQCLLHPSVRIIEPLCDNLWNWKSNLTAEILQTFSRNTWRVCMSLHCSKIFLPLASGSNFSAGQKIYAAVIRENEGDQGASRKAVEALEMAKLKLEKESRIVSEEREAIDQERKQLVELQNLLYHSQPVQSNQLYSHESRAKRDIPAGRERAGQDREEIKEVQKINRKEDGSLEQTWIYRERSLSNTLSKMTAEDDAGPTFMNEKNIIKEGSTPKGPLTLNAGWIAETYIPEDMLFLPRKVCSIGTQTEYLYQPGSPTGTTAVEAVVANEEEPEDVNHHAPMKQNAEGFHDGNEVEIGQGIEERQIAECGETARDQAVMTRDRENVLDEKYSSLERSQKDLVYRSDDLPNMGQIIVPDDDGSPEQAVEQDPEKVEKNFTTDAEQRTSSKQHRKVETEDWQNGHGDKEASDGETLHFENNDTADAENTLVPNTKNDKTTPVTDKPCEEITHVKRGTLGSGDVPLPMTSESTGELNDSTKSQGLGSSTGSLKDLCHGTGEQGELITSCDTELEMPNTIVEV